MHTGQRQHGQARRGAGVPRGTWPRRAGGAIIWALPLLLMASAACGEDRSGVSSVVDPVATSVAPATTETASVARVFAELAEATAPMTVYGLAELPEGATVPAEWWPIVDMETPSEYAGPSVANPRVSGGQADDVDAQLLIEYQDGWLAFLQNFRGDLGDVEGEDIGAVDGHAAALYEVNGGILVQWGDEGRWYGVFARGVAPDEVVRVALQMRAIRGTSGR